MGFTIYGEWAGPGVQKGVALASLPKKIFAVFAARPLAGSDELIIEPEQLTSMVEHIPDTYVIPWYTHLPMHGMGARANVRLSVNWRRTDEELTNDIAQVNEWVKEVENECSFTKQFFGISGTGEGLVFYPVSEAHLGYQSFQSLTWKAKGDKHKNIATAKPAQVSAEVALNASSFVEMVLTEARLEQGARTVALTQGSYDMKQTGKFVAWCLADVEKECGDELEASMLTFKQVQKPLSERARAWYLEKAKR